jgi:hypothetical protein
MFLRDNINGSLIRRYSVMNCLVFQWEIKVILLTTYPDVYIVGIIYERLTASEIMEFFKWQKQKYSL